MQSEKSPKIMVAVNNSIRNQQKLQLLLLCCLQRKT
ncbi:hypothetical protein SLEP1_g54895 [Rubroshorea leprosula]|uniref:Uncharacterized protein n=1 Tax=Rubroshorea leprosula TaxID=152421 RepID=A0AAV5MEU7_9ROSI|nr:hypothetical protein SLEP1_g54895 [Rubroshorea leprosula]